MGCMYLLAVFDEEQFSPILPFPCPSSIFFFLFLSLFPFTSKYSPAWFVAFHATPTGPGGKEGSYLSSRRSAVLFILPILFILPLYTPLQPLYQPTKRAACWYLFSFFFFVFFQAQSRSICTPPKKKLNRNPPPTIPYPWFPIPIPLIVPEENKKEKNRKKPLNKNFVKRKNF